VPDDLDQPGGDFARIHRLELQVDGTVASPGSLQNTPRKNSISEWNCVARRIDQGAMFSRTTASAATLVL
jgi:hypothetical protein